MEQAQARCLEVDRSRDRFTRYFFGAEADQPEQYDVVANSDRLPLDDVAAGVMDLMREKEERRTGCFRPPARADALASTRGRRYRLWSHAGTAPEPARFRPRIAGIRGGSPGRQRGRVGTGGRAAARPVAAFALRRSAAALFRGAATTDEGVGRERQRAAGRPRRQPVPPRTAAARSTSAWWPSARRACGASWSIAGCARNPRANSSPGATTSDAASTKAISAPTGATRWNIT